MNDLIDEHSDIIKYKTFINQEIEVDYLNNLIFKIQNEFNLLKIRNKKTFKQLLENRNIKTIIRIFENYLNDNDEDLDQDQDKKIKKSIKKVSIDNIYVLRQKNESSKLIYN